MKSAESFTLSASDAFACPNCRGAERWYSRKSWWIRREAVAHGVDVESAFAVYAVLSMNATVAENDKNYLRVLRGESARHFGDVLRRVDLALLGDIDGALEYVNGHKIPSFYYNLRWPLRADGIVTIDRHAADIVTGDRLTSRRLLSRKYLTGYDVLRQFYMVAAYRLGVRAHEVQARLWVHWLECEEGGV